MEIRVSNACYLCGLCVENCPTRVFRIVNKHLEVVQENCIYCRGCEVLCPVRAISTRLLDEGLAVSRRKTLISVK